MAQDVRSGATTSVEPPPGRDPGAAPDARAVLTGAASAMPTPAMPTPATPAAAPVTPATPAPAADAPVHTAASEAAGPPSGRRVRARLARLTAAKAGGVPPVLEPLTRTIRTNHPTADLRPVIRAYEVAER